MNNATSDNRQARIRNLNDGFRRDPSKGKIHITDGAISTIYKTGLDLVLKQIAEHQSFDDGNDPYKEHDFGSLQLGSEKLWWKIDYYAPDLQHGSDDPADPSSTTRVMTIMTPEEY